MGTSPNQYADTPPTAAGYAQDASTDPEQEKLVSDEQEEDASSEAAWRTRVHSVHNAALKPFRWVRMLAQEVNASFVFGVMVTYGVSQGFGGALYRVAGNYYWKDVQKVQPSVAQVYHGIIGSVWDWKPVWGMLTDLLPVCGYHRRPYFILSGLLSFISLMVLMVESKVHDVVAVFLLLCYTLGVTIADVIIDAEIAKQSRDKPNLAADIQTLCSISGSVGAFIGFSTSGYIVHLMGPKNGLAVLLVSGVLFILLGFVLQERRVYRQSIQSSQAGKSFQRTCKCILKTISCPQVWRPTLYMFISWAASPSISEGKFYWYTDPKHGLGFSQEFVGISFAAGSVGAFIGALAYQNLLKACSFRKILRWAQILVFLGGMVDLMLVLRWNLKLHLPDSLLFLIDEIFILAVGRLKWIPQLVLCAKLCPAGIEGTFFALLMAVDNVGLLTSSWSGALLQSSLGITRNNFDNLWLAAIIRNMLRLLPLGVLFLVPDTDPSEQVIPTEYMIIGEDPHGGEAEDQVELAGKTLAKESINQTGF